ncbi:MAG: PAS domain S-box protein [Proteobacteria bacterium]|nr:PAS domain S-box protein [Pseudomonadota bacterium]
MDMRALSSDLARSALDAAPDAIIIIDAGGTIRYTNRQVSAVFGYPHDEIVGRPVEFLMPERLRARHISHRRDYSVSVRVRPMGVGLDLLGRRMDGTEFPVEISLSPVEGSDEMLVAAAIRDVSDRKRVEAELTEAKETADRANQAKSRFLASASHDLRQPLQSLSLLNGALRRAVIDPEAGEAIKQQEQAITAMSRLLNTLLDISKLESGAVKPDPSDFAVGALFEEMRREFSGLASSKGLTLRILQCEECAHSDRMLVEQILKNLVSNAIKYTPEGWVSLRSSHPSPNAVKIEVHDTGVGIAKDQLSLIYDEFYQVGVPTNSARDGYGLGLSIVQRLVRLLGAELEVTSELGVGSTFTLTLPAGHGAAISAAAPSIVSSSGERSQMSVLLVEDDASVRNATKLLLKSEGYVVAVAATLAEALEQSAKMRKLDLLLTDYHLTNNETGLQVIAAVRDARSEQVKAVLITGDTSSAVQELKLDPHARIASKPIKADELIGEMKALTG